MGAAVLCLSYFDQSVSSTINKYIRNLCQLVRNRTECAKFEIPSREKNEGKKSSTVCDRVDKNQNIAFELYNKDALCRRHMSHK